MLYSFLQVLTHVLQERLEVHCKLGSPLASGWLGNLGFRHSAAAHHFLSAPGKQTICRHYLTSNGDFSAQNLGSDSGIKIIPPPPFPLVLICLSALASCAQLPSNLTWPEAEGSRSSICMACMLPAGAGVPAGEVTLSGLGSSWRRFSSSLAYRWGWLHRMS